MPFWTGRRLRPPTFSSRLHHNKAPRSVLSFFLSFMSQPNVREHQQNTCSQCNEPFGRRTSVWCHSCGYVDLRCGGIRSSRQWNSDFYCTSCRTSGLSQALEGLVISSPASSSNATSDPSAELLSDLRRLFTARCSVIKRIPRSSRNAVASKLTSLLNDVCADSADVARWCLLLAFPRLCLKTESRGGRNRRVRSYNDKCSVYSIADLQTFTPTVHKLRPGNATSLGKLVQSKIEEFDVKGAVRVVSASDSIAYVSDEVARQMEAKHPRALPAAHCRHGQ